MEEINLNKYIIVERTPSFNLSIKLVIPSGCNKLCPFCFNKLNRETASYSVNTFKRSFVDSLLQVVNTARKFNPNREISLDITGNEPTFDVELFTFVLEKIKRIKYLFSKVVLTTNGQNILYVCEQMRGVVDIVNVSVHHYLPSERVNAFGCYGIHSDDKYYKNIVKALKNAGIHTTAVAVIYKQLEEGFECYISTFSKWCKMIGFNDIRLRSNFYEDDDFFVEYMNDERFDTTPIVVSGLWSKKFNVNGIDVLMLKGIKSLISNVVGVEAVVDDNGLAYIDYGKEYHFKEIYVKHIYVK